MNEDDFAKYKDFQIREKEWKEILQEGEDKLKELQETLRANKFLVELNEDKKDDQELDEEKKGDQDGGLEADKDLRELKKFIDEQKTESETKLKEINDHVEKLKDGVEVPDDKKNDQLSEEEKGKVIHKKKLKFYTGEADEKLNRTLEFVALLKEMDDRKKFIDEHLKDAINTNLKSALQHVQAVVDLKTYFYQQIWMQNIPRLFLATSYLYTKIDEENKKPRVDLKPSQPNVRPVAKQNVIELIWEAPALPTGED